MKRKSGALMTAAALVLAGCGSEVSSENTVQNAAAGNVLGADTDGLNAAAPPAADPAAPVANEHAGHDMANMTNMQH